MTDTYRIVGLAGRGTVTATSGEDTYEAFLADLTLHAEREVDLAAVARAAADALAWTGSSLRERAERVAQAVRDVADVASVEVTLHRPDAALGVPVLDVEVTVVRPVAATPVPAPAVVAPAAAAPVEPAPHVPPAPEPSLDAADPADGGLAPAPAAPLPTPVPVAVGAGAAAGAGLPLPGGGAPVDASGDFDLPDLDDASEPGDAHAEESDAKSDAEADPAGDDLVVDDLDDAELAAAVDASGAGASNESGPGDQAPAVVTAFDSTGAPDVDGSLDPLAAPAAVAVVPDAADAVAPTRRPSADAPMPALFVLSSSGSQAQTEIAGAVRALGAAAGLEITGVSPLARTATAAGDLHSAVVAVTAGRPPGELVEVAADVSAARRGVGVELLSVGDLVGEHDGVELPLPGAASSATVLVPWAQLDPVAVLPGLGGGPVVVLAETAPDREAVRWLALDWLE